MEQITSKLIALDTNDSKENLVAIFCEVLRCTEAEAEVFIELVQ